MLTISDNAATDALLGRLGVDAVNASSARLGLTGTVITADLRTTINSIGQAAGFAGETRCGPGMSGRTPRTKKITCCAC